MRQDFGQFPDRDDQTDDFKVASSAIECLGRPHTKPFFIAVGLRRPHYPLYAPQQWFSLYDPQNVWLPEVPATDRDDLPRFARALRLGNTEPTLGPIVNAGLWRSHNHAYLACVSFVDNQIGRILDAWSSQGKHIELSLSSRVITVFIWGRKSSLPRGLSGSVRHMCLSYSQGRE